MLKTIYICNVTLTLRQSFIELAKTMAGCRGPWVENSTRKDVEGSNPGHGEVVRCSLNDRGTFTSYC